MISFGRYKKLSIKKLIILFGIITNILKFIVLPVGLSVLKKPSQNAWNTSELNSKYFCNLNQFVFCSTFWFGHMYGIEFV
jgi:predicted TIM-barrel enzyme